MTRRRWIADSWTDASATLSGPRAAHLARVLRAEIGMQFDIVAGEQVRRGVISNISEDAVDFALGEELPADRSLPLTLLLAVFKFDRMEWAIEKATELGVARIAPVIARRTEKHLAHSAVARVERWRRIAREAAQQSRRSDTVIIEDVKALKDSVADEPDALRLLLAEREQNRMLRDAIQDERSAPGEAEKKLRLAVGPEGGWTLEEETLFLDRGWKAASLGPRILRAETAAIAAMAVVSALWE